MVDKQLLDILVCPETKQALHQADDDVLRRLNESIAQGKVENRGGQRVGESVAAGLVREAGDLLYPIRDDIPIMLVDEAIPLSE